MKTKSNLYKLKMRLKLYTVMCNRMTTSVRTSRPAIEPGGRLSGFNAYMEPGGPDQPWSQEGHRQSLDSVRESNL